MNIEDIMGSINIFVCYFLLIIALSAFILKPRLEGVDIIKRFIMYMVFGNIYISTLVFILEYFNIFNRPILIISILFLSILLRFSLNKTGCIGTIKTIKMVSKNIILGKYGFRLLTYNIYDKTKQGIGVCQVSCRI